MNRSLSRDRRVLAFPLLCWIVVLVLALFVLSWAAASHHSLLVPHWAANFVFWAILGTAGFFMQFLSLLQKGKLELMQGIRAADAKLSLSRKRIIDCIHRLSGMASTDAMAPASAVRTPPPPPSTPGGRSLPSLELTPRLLAQRPQDTRVPRG
jgi:hypothetical protein